MQNTTDSESGVTVSEEPYIEEEREASNPIIYLVAAPAPALPVIDCAVLYNAPLKLPSDVGPK